MGSGDLIAFRDYLTSLPEELLENVTEDYVWLSRLGFGARQSTEFNNRRECCREECRRRGEPDLYSMAEETVWSSAA